MEVDESFVGPVDERVNRGDGRRYRGEIRGAGSLECHGSVTGMIELTGDIVIGESGRAKATLTGGRVVVDGILEGDAIGASRVEVGATGHVTGDIRAPAVAFAEGAVFEGNVEMRSVRGDGQETES